MELPKESKDKISGEDLASTRVCGKPRISIVIPVYNEKECIAEIISRLENLRREHCARLDLDYIFVDDGSNDNSVQIIRQKALGTSHIKLLELSRNFGHQIAVTAGVDAADGDYVAILDADLQDPPEYIIDMYELAITGYDLVYGKRRKRPGETLFKRVSASLFYRILGYFSDTPIPLDTGDFRLFSRRVADVFRQMRERHRFIRGMIPWIGFPSAAFEYDRNERFDGTTKYPCRKMVEFAVNALLSFSSRPLVLVIQMGILLCGIGMLGSVYILVLKLFTNIVVAGITSIILFFTFFGGIQILTTGIVGSYVAKLFEEAKNRPLYVTKDRTNI
jgi:polyisoprenyl-phosphate glycosyltransferase